MEKKRQIALAERFRQLHHSGETMVLPNAWDAMSAKLFEQEGFSAVATSSASVSWAFGYPDGEVIPADKMLLGIENIARSVSVPVTADIEGGFYWDNLEQLSVFIEQVIDTGVVGVNLEDTRHGCDGLIDVSTMIKRINTVREASDKKEIPLFINARVDAFTQNHWSQEQQISEVVRRALLYQEAGADGIFVPFITDIKIIKEIKAKLSLPMNVLFTSSLDIAELKQIGVERISIGSRPAMSLYGKLKKMAHQLHQTEDWSVLSEEIVPYDQWNEWFLK